MNFDYCPKTKEENKNKKKHSTVINNFYFLVFERRQMGGDIQNHEPQT